MPTKNPFLDIYGAKSRDRRAALWARDEYDSNPARLLDLPLPVIEVDGEDDQELKADVAASRNDGKALDEPDTAERQSVALQLPARALDELCRIAMTDETEDAIAFAITQYLDA